MLLLLKPSANADIGLIDGVMTAASIDMNSIHGTDITSKEEVVNCHQAGNNTLLIQSSTPTLVLTTASRPENAPTPATDLLLTIDFI